MLKSTGFIVMRESIEYDVPSLLQNTRAPLEYGSANLDLNDYGSAYFCKCECSRYISGIIVNMLYILSISVALEILSENLVGGYQIKWANMNMRARNGRASTLSNKLHR